MRLIKPLINVLKEPAFLPYYWRQLSREFRLFDFDYRFLDGYSFPPKSICLILTERCNLQCAMCDIGQKNAQNSTTASFPLTASINKGESALKLENWKQLVDDIVAKEWDPLLLLTGTEPFLYPQVTELIDYIVASKLRLHITTNGTLLSRYAENLVDLCTKPGSITLTISLDGIGEVHDSIRGVKGTFDRAVKGLQVIYDRKKRLKSKWPEVSLCYTISNFNDHHINEFVDWFYHRDFGLKSITFSHLWFKDKTIVEKQIKSTENSVWFNRPTLQDWILPQSIWPVLQNNSVRSVNRIIIFLLRSLSNLGLQRRNSKNITRNQLKWCFMKNVLLPGETLP